MKMVTAAQKKASAKWDAENTKVISCKLRKDDFEAFKAYAESQGSTPGRLIREYALECIGKNN